MKIEQIYAAVCEDRAGDVLPHWDDLRPEIRAAMAAAFNVGITTAAEYVDGNWADAHTMAAHLRDVADGKKPMYAD